jgi:hypothetical protein
MGRTPPQGRPAAPVAVDGAARPNRLASPVTALVLGAVALILMAAAIALSGPVHKLSVLGSGPVVPVVVIYAGGAPRGSSASSSSGWRSVPGRPWW